jgi:hypothetical protein
MIYHFKESSIIGTLSIEMTVITIRSIKLRLYNLSVQLDFSILFLKITLLDQI